MSRLAVLNASVGQTWPQPQRMAPLKLEGDGPNGLICHHTLPNGLVIPTGPDKRFWRGDAWGVTVPGLPFVPGGSSRHPERALTWFFDRYPETWQQEILHAYRRRGYTHWVLSWPDSRDGYSQSVSQYVATAQKVKQAIPYVAHFLTSKVYDPKDATADDRMGSIAPVIDALVSDGVADILVVGWELDSFNRGDYLEDFIHKLHARYPSIDLWVHFTTYKTAWQPDGQPRDQFWRATQGELTGLLYQANQNDTCGQMSAHFNDAQVDASGIRAAGALLVAHELLAANEFDNDRPNEDDACARGWATLCTPGPLLASGFGNGGRFPDGASTLLRY